MLYVLDEPSVGLHPRDIDSAGRRIAGSARSRQHGRRRRARRSDDPRGRPGRRNRPGAGERGGQVVFQGTPREMEASPRSLTGDFLSGRRGVSHARATPRRQSRLDSPGRRARQQPAEPVTVEFPARRAVRGDRRQRIGQEHAGRGHALSGPLPADAQGGPGAAAVRRRVRRRPDRRRDPGRSKPDRPLAALEPGDLHQGLRRNPRRVCRDGRSPHAQLHGQPFQLQRRRRPLHARARATATSRSTCSFWPTCT